MPSTRRCSGSSSSCPSRRGTTSGSIPAGWSCCWPTQRPRRTPGGVLVIDDSGDRKDGKATAHVGRQWLGRLDKTDNGIVTVTTFWADENFYYPLHAVPYSPAHHFPRASATSTSARSCRSPQSWPAPRRLPGWPSAPWPPTAPTATRTASAGNSTRRGCRERGAQVSVGHDGRGVGGGAQRAAGSCLAGGSGRAA
ncbi:transposase [Streptomyces sp. NPDC056949]|uniref:transposase n=1 Tax=Streptomyces sp. NPDC056949 TaxID=3345976 RepID=UPI003636378C